MTALNGAPVAERPPRLLYTFDAAADQLSCSPRQVRLLVQTGALGSVRIGRLHRIPLSDLEAYVRGLQANSRPGGEE